jgi:hypothetical protein
VSRLEDIAKRNEGAARFSLKSNFAFGLRSIFLLVILAGLIFTKWALPPKDTRPGINIVDPRAPKARPAPSPDGVYLMQRPAAPKPAKP